MPRLIVNEGGQTRRHAKSLSGRYLLQHSIVETLNVRLLGNTKSVVQALHFPEVRRRKAEAEYRYSIGTLDRQIQNHL